MKKVFLSGTTNGSNWRNELKELLEVDYFDPSELTNTKESYEKINAAKTESDYLLYVITPKMTGYNNIAEAVDFSNKYPQKTIFCFLLTDGQSVFSKFEVKSLNAVGKLIAQNGAMWLKDFEAIADFLKN